MGADDGLSNLLSVADEGSEAPACQHCGGRTRRRAKRSVSPLSLLGRLRIKRGWWSCDTCSGSGSHPLDEALGMPGGKGRG